ncbi:MAG: outer membrane protein assembly factor BamA [Treponema sp.]
MIKKGAAVIVMLLLVWSISAQAADGWYENKPITSITFTGLKTVSKAELAGIFDPYKGVLFSEAVYSEILQKLYALDYFAEITPKAIPADSDYQYVTLEFSVVEKPAVSLIKITGNYQLSKGDILSKTVLKKGDIYNEDQKNADIQSIKNYYFEKGYAASTVSATTTTDSQGDIMLEFIIEEGTQTIVTDIQFQGNTIITAKALAKVLKTRQAYFLDRGIFKESALEEDKTEIHRFYAECGYIDAHVEQIIREVDSETNPKKNMLKLTYVIMEGEQYIYDGLYLQGNRIFSTEELSAKIKLTPGSILNMTKIEQGVQDINDKYADSGYTTSIIEHRIERNDSTKKAVLALNIIEHDRSHIEHIIINGNKRTKDQVILRELLLEPGDIFSKNRLLASLRNLFNLRYFSTVTPEIRPGSEVNLIDIIFNVEETPTASVNFGLTFSGISDSTSIPLSLGVQWQERNLFGNGNDISATVNVSADTQSIQTGYNQRWLWGYPLNIGFDVSLSHKKLFTYQDVLFPRFSDEDSLAAAAAGSGTPPDPFRTWEEFKNNPGLANAYRMSYDRMETSFGPHAAYSWFPNFAMVTLRGGITFSIVKNFYDSHIFRPADRMIRRQQKRWGLNNSIWTRISLDTRDINYDPSSGWFFSEQVSFTGLFPKIEDEYFFRSETKAETYFQLLDYPVSDIWNLKFVLAFYSGFAFQIPLPSSTISESNKLAVDGMFTGRGWLGLGPAGRGDVLLYHWTELRWPLVPGILALDLFFDAAAIKPKLTDIKALTLNDYYFSFGPGLRILIPNFPLRLMLADTFRAKNGQIIWGDGGKKSSWQFVLSFNVLNL